MKYNGFQWSLKVWLSSSLLTPIVIIPVMLAVGRALAPSMSALIGGLLYIIIPLLLVSLVPWLIVLLFLRRLTRSRLSSIIQKLVVFLVVTILSGSIFLIGALASPSTDWTGMYALLGYAIASALCIRFYKLTRVDATHNALSSL